MSQVLNLSAWHNDTFGRNSFLGEIELDLSSWDFNDTEMKLLPLKPRVQYECVHNFSFLLVIHTIFKVKILNI